MATNAAEALEELDIEHIQFTKEDGRTQILYPYGVKPYQQIGSVTVNSAEALIFEKVIMELRSLRAEVSALKKKVHA